MAMLMVMAGSFLLLELSSPPHRERRRALFEDALRLRGDRALRTLDAEGRAASDAMLNTLSERTGISMVLLRDDEPVEGRAWEGLDGALRELRARPRRGASTARERREEDQYVTLIDLPTGSVLTSHHRSSSFDRFVGPHLWARHSEHRKGKNLSAGDEAAGDEGEDGSGDGEAT